MYRWELDSYALQEFASLSTAARARLAEFMDAVVIADPAEYQRRTEEASGPAASLRTLHFGSHSEGLVTMLLYPPDDLVLVVKIQWLGE